VGCVRELQPTNREVIAFSGNRGFTEIFKIHNTETSSAAIYWTDHSLT